MTIVIISISISTIIDAWSCIGWNVSSVCRHGDWDWISQRAYRHLTHRQHIPTLSLLKSWPRMAGKRWCPRGRPKSYLSTSDFLNSRANIARRWSSAPMKILDTSVDLFEAISNLRYLDRALWWGLKRSCWRRETSCVSAISSLSSVARWNLLVHRNPEMVQ